MPDLTRAKTSGGAVSGRPALNGGADIHRQAHGQHEPNKPEGYDELNWAPTLPAVENVKATLETRMVRKPMDRTVKSVKEVGWLFEEV